MGRTHAIGVGLLPGVTVAQPEKEEKRIRERSERVQEHRKTCHQGNWIIYVAPNEELYFSADPVRRFRSRASHRSRGVKRTFHVASIA